MDFSSLKEMPPFCGDVIQMNATRIALLTLCAALLISGPAEAQDEPATEDPCPAVQTMLHDPYVTVHPDCIDDTAAWVVQQI